MLLSERRRLQIEASILAICVTLLVFGILFFSLRLSLLGIHIPDTMLPRHNASSHKTIRSLPITWYKQTPQTQQAVGSGQTASSAGSTTQTATSSPPSTDQDATQDATQDKQEHTEEAHSQDQSERQTESIYTSHTTSQTSQNEQAQQQEYETSSTLSAQPKPHQEQHEHKRTGRDKWFKKQKQTREANTQHTRTEDIGKQIQKAVTATHTSSGIQTLPSSQHSKDKHEEARSNAQAFEKETFLEKSVKAISRASYQQQPIVYTASTLRSMMYITTYIDRNGDLLDLQIEQTSGDRAIDNAVLYVVRSADFPPIPSDQEDAAVSLPITIDMYKPQGRHPVILKVARR